MGTLQHNGKLKCASFFAGVGGIDLGFGKTEGFETIYANEFDPFPVKTFELNFPNIKVDIYEKLVESIPMMIVFGKC